MTGTNYFLEKILDKNFGEMYDESFGLFGKEVDYRKNGYHSKEYGYRHIMRESAIYASAALICNIEKYEGKAKIMLEKICDAQDKNPQSPTFGLWGYLFEETPDRMLNPDYNWADFIGKWLVCVLRLCPDKLSDTLKQKLLVAVNNAAQCSMKRNVKIDYTNIRVMSPFLQIAAGELTGNKVIFDHGKEALTSLLEYTQFNTAFTEYNSSTYTITAIDEIAKMLVLFKDEECLETAKKLNVFAWKQFSIHYNDKIKQLSPPQSRAYKNIDNGQLGEIIYLATDGKYGTPLCGNSEVDTLVFPPKCPEELLGDFQYKKERFDIHEFFKADKKYEYQGDMGTGSVTSYSYMTDTYSMGCFSCADFWVQKRPLMAIWGKDKPAFLRLRSFHNDYDFCSGLVRAAQNKNTIIASAGFCTDRGSFHFSLDKNKSGIYNFEKLFFRLDADGYTDEMTIDQKDNIITLTDRDMKITINVSSFVFDGKKGKIVIDNENKNIDFICYEGEDKVIDLNTLADSYCIFTLSTNADAPDAEIKENGDNINASIEGASVTFPKTPRTLAESICR